MVFDKEAYKQFILDNERITFSPEFFRLASGQKSRFYINWRKEVNEKTGITSGKNAEIIADYVLDFLEDKEIEIDTFIGVPESMTMFAGVIQKKQAERKNLDDYGLVALRKEPKTHGDIADRFFIGKPHGKIAVLEDITTTGGSLINKGIKAVQNTGYDVETAIALVNRCPPLANKGIKPVQNTDLDIEKKVASIKKVPGKNYVDELVKKETGVNYFSLIHAFDLLPEAYNRFIKKLEDDLKNEILEYRDLRVLKT